MRILNNLFRHKDTAASTDNKETANTNPQQTPEAAANSDTTNQPSAADTTEQQPSAAKRVLNLLIVDESGSMSVIQQAALSGMNETLTTCQLAQQQYPDMEQRMTLITFDSGHFHVHYDDQTADKIAPLESKDYCPRGCTPLYDAIGKGVAMVRAKQQNGDNVLVTIITDGMENASREFTLNMVKELIEQLKDQGWTFALIGTNNLDVESMSTQMSIDNHFSFPETEDGTSTMWEHERTSRAKYYKKSSRGEDVLKYFEDL